MLIIAFVISTGASYFFLKGKFTFDTSFVNELASRQAKTENKEQKEETRRLYDFKATTEGTETGKDAALASAEDAIKRYLKTYRASLQDLYMDKDGIVYIDLGNELKKDFKGDASEELNIIAGLYKCIEPVVPGLTAIKILIEGHEAETLGGHLDISKPIGKEIAENI
ncbi:MAG: hypothetical protein HZB61_00870 [Nitrospirae bacterium]|nr:hypothetical protein [Nitrospirota bacterium]